jgi:hypothetical protein
VRDTATQQRINSVIRCVLLVCAIGGIWYFGMRMVPTLEKIEAVVMTCRNELGPDKDTTENDARVMFADLNPTWKKQVELETDEVVVWRVSFYDAAAHMLRLYVRKSDGRITDYELWDPHDLILGRGDEDRVRPFSSQWFSNTTRNMAGLCVATILLSCWIPREKTLTRRIVAVLAVMCLASLIGVELLALAYIVA